MPRRDWIVFNAAYLEGLEFSEDTVTGTTILFGTDQAGQLRVMSVCGSIFTVLIGDTFDSALEIQCCLN